MLGRLLKGDYGLPKTFWLWGTLGPCILWLLIVFVGGSSVSVMLTKLLVAVIYLFVVWIAIWRAANSYAGAPIWATLAKACVVLEIVGFVALVIAVVFFGAMLSQLPH